MLPKLPGLGVWRMESHGWNAASILPGTLDLLLMAAAEHTFIPAVLRLEQRTSKQDGKTRKFVVPVIDLPSVRLEQLAGPAGLPGLNGPSVAPPRPGLPAVEKPVAEAFDHAEPGFGARPALPDSGGGPETSKNVAADSASVSQTATHESAPPPDVFINREQQKLLFATADEHGVSKARIKAILREHTGQESSKAITRDRFDVVLAALERDGAAA
jgi:hypothetical protein